MKVLLVAGARPNFMKVAPILTVLTREGHHPVLVHTGQHYDHRMSTAFFADLALPEPDHHLGIGSASHARQTGRIMEAFEPVLIMERPAWVVVVGDVNSTLACALVAAKLKEETGCQLAHVEAGLRSHDWRMPEEVNRVLTDRLSDLLFIPSRDALANLQAEGIPEARVAFVGNVMIDSLFAWLPRARALDLPTRLGLDRGRFAVATVHRPSNVDAPDSLTAILEGLLRVAECLPVVVPLHPRTTAAIHRFGLGSLVTGLRVVDPLGYAEMLSLVDCAAMVLTDSGGLQEETTVLGVPCVTLREQTERPITVSCGTNRLVPWPVTADRIWESFNDALACGRAAPGTRSPEGWDGKAAERIVHELCRS